MVKIDPTEMARQLKKYTKHAEAASRAARYTGQLFNVHNVYQEEGAEAAAGEAAKSIAEDFVYDAFSGRLDDMLDRKQATPSSRTPSPQANTAAPSPQANTAAPSPQTNTATPSANQKKSTNAQQDNVREGLGKRNEKEKRKAEAERDKKRRESPANHNKKPNSPYRKGETPAPKTKAQNLIKNGKEFALKEGKEKIEELLLKEGLTDAEIKAAEKMGEKITSKLGLKTIGKIPGISLIMGAYYAGGRFAEGDYTGCALELLSGTAACIPGGGTYISAVIDVYLFGRDVKTELDAVNEKYGSQLSLTKEQKEELDQFLAQMSPEEKAKFKAQRQAVMDGVSEIVERLRQENLQFFQPLRTSFETELLANKQDQPAQEGGNQSARQKSQENSRRMASTYRTYDMFVSPDAPAYQPPHQRLPLGMTAWEVRGGGDRANEARASQTRTTGASNRNTSTRNTPTGSRTSRQSGRG